MNTKSRLLVRGACIIDNDTYYDTIDIFQESEYIKAIECADNAFFSTYKENEGYDYVEVIEQFSEYEPEIYEFGTNWGGWGDYVTVKNPSYRIYNPDYKGE